MSTLSSTESSGESTIVIKVDCLTDSPFSGGADHQFIFDQSVLTDIVNHLLYGHPTCYLITGYRGAGKSSFINKVESTIPKDKRLLFVHVNFAKYQSHQFVLRRLIRGLHQQMSNAASKNGYDYLIEKEEKEGEREEDRTSWLLRNLYDQTFHEINRSDSSQKGTFEETKVEIDWLLLTGFGVVGLMAIINLVVSWLPNSQLPSAITALGAMLGVIRQILLLKRTNTSHRRQLSDINRKTLYDNEIADYYFTVLLKGLRDKGIGVAFVMDELDKIEEDSVIKLLQEMKPFLQAGLANFIIVAGQELYYQYKSAATEDDGFLATLFSRQVHIPLLSKDEFYALFRSLLKDDHQLFKRTDFIDYFIYKSKRVPRRFIHLIREKLYWKDQEPHLSVEPEEAYQLYSDLMTAVGIIVDEQISVQFQGPDRDYLGMQLFLMAERLVAKSWKQADFTRQVLMPVSSSVKSVEGLQPFLEEYADSFLDRLKQKGLIRELPEQDSQALKKYQLAKREMKQEKEAVGQKENSRLLMLEFYDFRNIATAVWRYVRPDKKSVREEKPLRVIVAKLIERGAINPEWKNNGLVLDFLDTADLLLTSTESAAETILSLEQQNVSFGSHGLQLLRFLTRFFLAEKFGAYDPDQSPDSAETNAITCRIKLGDKVFNFLIDVKLRKGHLPVAELIQGSWNQLLAYEDSSAGQYHMLTVIYTDSGPGELATLRYRFRQNMEMRFPQMLKFLHFMPLSIGFFEELEASFNHFKNSLEEQSKMTFTLKSKFGLPGHPGYDDDFFPRVFDLQQYDVELFFRGFSLTQFSCLGLKFSANGDFPSNAVRYDATHPLFHLVQHQNQLDVLYNFYGAQGNSLEQPTLVSAQENTVIRLKVASRDHQVYVDIQDAAGTTMIDQPVHIGDFHFFRVHAWADRLNQFEFEADAFLRFRQ